MPKTDNPRFVSPDEIMAAAKLHMIEGREPTTLDDWNLIANFVASNIAEGYEEFVYFILGLYKNPLSKEEVTRIAEFQAQKKRERKN